MFLKKSINFWDLFVNNNFGTFGTERPLLKSVQLNKVVLTCISQ